MGLTMFVGSRGRLPLRMGLLFLPTRGPLWPLMVAVGGRGAGPLPLGTVQSGPQT